MKRRWCEGPCGRELPETLEYFESTGYRWLARVCRACRRTSKRIEYRTNTSHRLRERDRRRRMYAETSADRERSYSRSYYHAKGKVGRQQRVEARRRVA